MVFVFVFLVKMKHLNADLLFHATDCFLLFSTYRFNGDFRFSWMHLSLALAICPYETFLHFRNSFFILRSTLIYMVALN